MQRGVQSRSLRHGLCDGCGLVRGQIVEIVVAAVVVAVGSGGAVLHEPGLVVKGRAVHHFRWGIVLLGFFGALRAVSDFRWRRCLAVLGLGLVVLRLWLHPRGQ